MRLSTSNEYIVREIDKICRSKVSEINTSGRETCLRTYDNYAKNCELKRLVFRHASLKRKRLFIEILYTHYLHEDIRALFQEELLRVVSKMSNLLDRELFKKFVYNKGLQINYLFETSHLWKTDNDFFGSLKAIEFETKVFVRRHVDEKYLFNPIVHSRVRGYRDKGSLGSTFYGNKEWLKDYRSTAENNKRLERRQSAEFLADFIEGWIM